MSPSRVRGSPVSIGFVQQSHFDPQTGIVPFEVRSGTGNRAMYISESSDIGLGTATPATGLHVQHSDGKGAVLIEETSAGTFGQLTLRNNGITFFTLEDTSIAAGDDTGRSWNFQNQAGTFRVTTAPGGANDIEMILTPAGDLTIEGDFFSNSGTPVPDDVFDADYDLRPLSDVAQFIAVNKHLPDVPSAAQIAKHGHNMIKMQMALLQKVEELTLYTLEQDRVNTAQAAELDRLRGLEARLIRLEASVDR